MFLDELVIVLFNILFQMSNKTSHFYDLTGVFAVFFQARSSDQAGELVDQTINFLLHFYPSGSSFLLLLKLNIQRLKKSEEKKTESSTS